jgi:hypothetical protein
MKKFEIVTENGAWVAQGESMFDVLANLKSMGGADKEVVGIKEIPTATVKSLMNGKDVVIDAKNKGTCVDPSTETYWCM